MVNPLQEIEAKLMSGELITFGEALELSKSNDLEGLFKAANRIREKYQGKKVELCTIMNAKSGQCSENCKFCAQSAHYSTGIEGYPLVTASEALKLAKENEESGASRFSLVTSGKSISKDDFEQVIEIYELLRQETNLKLCASHGLLNLEQALKLKAAGVTMYHHNLETGPQFFSDICDTHSYQDRIDTIENVMKAGLDVCSGGIIGMGETMEDRLQLAFELKKLKVKSIPINILTPIKGTPLEEREILDAKEAIKTMAIFRFINPDAYIRYAGGRNALGELQRLGFKAGVNAALVGNFLTTVGNNISQDIAMIKEEGLEV